MKVFFRRYHPALGRRKGQAKQNVMNLNEFSELCLCVCLDFAFSLSVPVTVGLIVLSSHLSDIFDLIKRHFSGKIIFFPLCKHYWKLIFTQYHGLNMKQATKRLVWWRFGPQLVNTFTERWWDHQGSGQINAIFLSGLCVTTCSKRLFIHFPGFPDLK